MCVSDCEICYKELVHSAVAAKITNATVPVFSQDGAGRSGGNGTSSSQNPHARKISLPPSSYYPKAFNESV